MDELEHRRRPLLPPSPGDARVVGATDATATHSKKFPIEYFGLIYSKCVLTRNALYLTNRSFNGF